MRMIAMDFNLIRSKRRGNDYGRFLMYEKLFANKILSESTPIFKVNGMHSQPLSHFNIPLRIRVCVAASILK